MKNKTKSLPVKINLSSTQVLKTLKMLTTGDYTMSELVERLNENEPEPIFNHGAVSKYINTCRYCGIEVPKIHNRYFVSKIPFGIDISNNEYELINYLQNRAHSALSASANKKLINFFTKVSRFSNREIEKANEESLEKIYSIYENAIRDETKLMLLLKNKTSLKCVPVNILEYNGKQYFHVYHEDKERNILIERVAGIEVLKEKFNKLKADGAVIFKLFGALAKNYTLHENEKILENNLPETITIVNYNENKLILLSRLLRYGDLCEIVSPSHLRLRMKTIIDETLSNYGE